MKGIYFQLALYCITDTSTLVEGVRSEAATEIDGDMSHGQKSVCRQRVAGDARVDSVSPATSEHLRLALYRITDTATLVEGVRSEM